MRIVMGTVTLPAAAPVAVTVAVTANVSGPSGRTTSGFWAGCHARAPASARAGRPSETPVTLQSSLNNSSVCDQLAARYAFSAAAIFDPCRIRIGALFRCRYGRFVVYLAAVLFVFALPGGRYGQVAIETARPSIAAGNASGDH